MKTNKRFFNTLFALCFILCGLCTTKDVVSATSLKPVSSVNMFIESL